MKKGILVHGENFFKIFICAKGVAGAGRRREDQLRRGAANSVILTNGDGACDRRAFYLLPNVNLHPVVLEIFRLIPVLPVTSVMHPVACLRCGSMYRGKLEALSSLCSSKIIMGP